MKKELEDRLLDSVEESLERGIALKEWWERTYSAGSFAERFELGETFNRPDSSFGFFDKAPVAGRDMRVMGNFQEMLYDKPKSPSGDEPKQAEWMRDQLREFVLRYFMRVSDFRQPEAYVSEDAVKPPIWLRPISFAPEDVASRVGFGFSQLFYKRADTGEIGRFPKADRHAIVDLREIGTTYEWIVVKVKIFDFSFDYEPLGARGPALRVPLAESSYLVLSPELISNQDDPDRGRLGRYGTGYAFIKDPKEGVLAYGPGEFDAAIELIDFQVSADGNIRVSMVFVANRPKRVLNVSLDPIDWSYTLADAVTGGAASRVTAPVKKLLDAMPFRGFSFDPVYSSISMVNLLTAGAASRELGISRRTLENEFLVKHFMQHHTTVAGSLQTWRQIPDWLEEGELPTWVREGTSS